MDWEMYLKALFVFALIVGFGELARWLLEKFKVLAHFDVLIRKFLLNTIRVCTIILGVIIFLGTIGVDFSALVMEKYLAALFVFAGIVALGELARRLLDKFKVLAHIDDHIRKFLMKSIRVGTIVFGSISFLGTIGVDISALVTGLGLTGFAVGLALKDVISNVIAGIMLIIYRPFAKGDLLEVKSFRGTVNSVDLRYTTLDNNGQRIFIPNSLMFKETITVLESNRPQEEENEPSVD